MPLPNFWSPRSTSSVSLFIPTAWAVASRIWPNGGRHIVGNLRARAAFSPDPRLDAFAAELEGYLPATSPGAGDLGFAIPLRLRTDEGELRLITTLTSFATAVDITLAELHLEAFLPADAASTQILYDRAYGDRTEAEPSLPQEPLVGQT